MQLQTSRLDWVRGLTVQVLPRHPDIPTAFLWAHNLREEEPTDLAIYDNQPKPAGWGNGGGGLEKTDLETLSRILPNHPILNDRSLSDDERLIIAGGIREFVYETGYKGIDIVTDYPGVFLFEYVYRDWVDAKGILHPGGHRKITLWGEITSFKVHEDYRLEKHEVDRTAWFDLSESLYRYFFNPVDFPDRPYWSHVRSSLVGMLRIYGYLKANSDGPVENIPRRIHPSWWYINQIGQGDSRFPVGGFKMSPTQWYRLFEIMVARRMEEASNEFLARFFSKEIDQARRSEEQKFERAVTEPRETTIAVEGSEDSDGIPTLEEMRMKEDEEVGRWLERELGLQPR